MIIVLLGFYVASGRKEPLAQQPSRPFAVVDGGVQMATGADGNPPAVILAPTFTAEPARRLIVGQLGELNERLCSLVRSGSLHQRNRVA